MPETASASILNRRPKDIRVAPFPQITAAEWREPAEVLDRLYRETESHAIEVADWYLRDRQWKRRLSLTLRAGAIVLAAGGALQPLISAAGSGHELGWGYVLLASGGACVAFDHFFGLSTRWMRDVVTAQRVQRRLLKFQYDWAALSAWAAPATPETVPEHLDLLRLFVQEVSDITVAETAEWVDEFQTGISQMKSQAGVVSSR